MVFHDQSVEISSEIEKLECVDYVYELFMMPDNLKHAMLRDSNIYPVKNGLLYPGKILLETITSSIRVK